MHVTRVPVTRLSDSRVHTTPNATMRTYSSPSLNGASLAVWRTEMAAGAVGPTHTISAEQVLVVVAGRLAVAFAEAEVQAGPGDSVCVPAQELRTLRNAGEEPLTFVAASAAGAVAQVDGGEPVVVPWAR
jgi:quercetin dioxygenase-like cupin family protein